GFAPALAARAARLDAAWSDGATIDLRRDLERLSLTAAGDALLATDLEPLAGELLEGLGTVMGAVPRLLPPLPGTAGGRALAGLERRMDELLSASTGEGDDLVSVLARSGLPRELACGELIAHLAAVVDEPPSALTAAWYFLAQDGEADELLRAELAGCSPAELAGAPAPPFLDAVLREALRLLPPARHIDRCPVADVVLDGETARRGTTVLVSPLVTHREPSLYPEPDRFLPSRWLDADAAGRSRGAFVPFGAGPHACIGEPFARTIMITTMATIVPRWRLSLDGSPPPPVPRTPRPRFRLARR
ncbi:MAG: hypothetical protein QOE29_309, partial [Gaiellaceae bacterium]|nr:hypothetical protein [Gaiellaceae bacterium]